jgi:hypothetical protein
MTGEIKIEQKSICIARSGKVAGQANQGRKFREINGRLHGSIQYAGTLRALCSPSLQAWLQPKKMG